MVTTEGGNASFQCIITSKSHRDRDLSIQWLMNGSAALVNETIEQGNAMVYFRNNSSQNVHLLEFTEIPLEFNQTSIKCSLSSSQQAQVLESFSVLLQLQGKLQRVCYN